MSKEFVATAKAPQARGPYSQGIRLGQLLFVSAQGPFSPETGKLAGEDVETQTRRVLENIKGVVEASGLTLHDVVKVTVFLKHSEDFQRMNEVYKTYFPEHAPARTTIQAELPIPGALVGADAIACR